jgi:glyoxylase-like metal-dependent hydrolase (beta-lactamase superfamily II)
VDPGDVRLIVNCHLHRDHCGGNPELPGRPVFVQRVELEAAREPGYTVPARVGSLQALEPRRVLLAHDLASVEAAAQAR